MFHYYMVAFKHRHGADIIQVHLSVSDKARVEKFFIERFSNEFQDIEVLSIKETRFIYSTCL